MATPRCSTANHWSNTKFNSAIEKRFSRTFSHSQNQIKYCGSCTCSPYKLRFTKERRSFSNRQTPRSLSYFIWLIAQYPNFTRNVWNAIHEEITRIQFLIISLIPTHCITYALTLNSKRLLPTVRFQLKVKRGEPAFYSRRDEIIILINNRCGFRSILIIDLNTTSCLHNWHSVVPRSKLNSYDSRIHLVRNHNMRIAIRKTEL